MSSESRLDVTSDQVLPLESPDELALYNHMKAVMATEAQAAATGQSRRGFLHAIMAGGTTLSLASLAAIGSAKASDEIVCGAVACAENFACSSDGVACASGFVCSEGYNEACTTGCLVECQDCQTCQNGCLTSGCIAGCVTPYVLVR